MKALKSIKFHDIQQSSTISQRDDFIQTLQNDVKGSKSQKLDKRARKQKGIQIL